MVQRFVLLKSHWIVWNQLRDYDFWFYDLTSEILHNHFLVSLYEKTQKPQWSDSNVNNNLLSIQEKLTFKLDRLSRESLKKLGQRVLSRIVTKIDQPGPGCCLALCLMTKIMPIHAGFEVETLDKSDFGQILIEHSLGQTLLVGPLNANLIEIPMDKSDIR